MANKKQVLDKISRDLAQLGIPNTRGSANEVLIDNGSNDLTVSYVDAAIQSPMGGVDGSVSPYLGIGVGNPGQIKLTSSIHTGTSMADIIDSAVAAQVLAVMAGFANDLKLSNDNASFTADIRANADQRGLGQ